MHAKQHVRVVQDRLTARGSQVVAVAAHPGASATELQVTSAKAGFGLQGILNFFMIFGQTEEDGSMPLLHATAAAAVKPGGLYVPSKKGLVGFFVKDGMTGPPMEKTPEASCSKLQVTELLWKKSEEACGLFFKQ
jgi:hypothetical protein